MKKVALIISFIMLLSCSQREENVFCEVSFEIVLPEAKKIEAISADLSLRNINTQRVERDMSISKTSFDKTILKGVYHLLLEAQIVYIDKEGNRKRAIARGYKEGYEWISDKDSCEIELLLMNM